MARLRGDMRRIEEILKKYDREVQQAFLAAIVAARRSVDIRALEAALGSGDIGRAVELLRLNQALLFPLDEAISAAYVAGGQMIAAGIPASAGVLGFDGRAIRAEQWARQHVGGLITGLVEEQRETVVAAVRDVTQRQIAAGMGPRQAALDIAGRVSPRGVREGGILGLDGPRAERLRVVTEAMRTPEGVRGLVIERRDGTLAMRYKVNRATELRILRARKAGDALSAADQAISARQYGNALLQARGETIARTESITALRAGRDEGIRQAVEQGVIAEDRVKRVWDATGDARTRPDHAAMHGTEVDGLDAPFVLPDGSQMMHPGDTSLGADAGQTINCRCLSRYEVDWLRESSAGADVALAQSASEASSNSIWANKSADEVSKVAPAFAAANPARLAIIREVGDLRGGVSRGKGSHYRDSDLSIQMDGGREGMAYSRVMRHEYGHHIDARIEAEVVKRQGGARAGFGVSRLAKAELKKDAQSLEATVSTKTRNLWTGQSPAITPGFAEKVDLDRAALSSKYRQASREGDMRAVIAKDFQDRGLDYAEAREMFPHIFVDGVDGAGARADASRFLAAFDNNDHAVLVYGGGARMTHSSALSGLSDSLGAATNQRIGYQFGHAKKYYADMRAHDKRSARLIGDADTIGGLAPTGGKYAYGSGNTAQLWANWFEAYTSGSETQYTVFKKLFPATSGRFEDILERFLKDGTVQ